MILQVNVITSIRLFRQLFRLVRCYVNLSDNDVDLSDDYMYVDLSDNFVVICMTLTGQEHVFKIYLSDKSTE